MCRQSLLRACAFFSTMVLHTTTRIYPCIMFSFLLCFISLSPALANQLQRCLNSGRWDELCCADEAVLSTRVSPQCAAENRVSVDVRENMAQLLD